jgi:hypothetical protein
MIIKRVAPFSCAKVVGAIYAIFMLLFACMATIVSLISAIARISTGGSSPLSLGGPYPLPMIILPILYGIGVFLATLIGVVVQCARRGFRRDRSGSRIDYFAFSMVRSFGGPSEYIFAES